jgi:ParB/RepB/Spo0J family partition protein
MKEDFMKDRTVMFGETKKGRRSGRQDSNELRTLKETKDSKDPGKGAAAAEVSKKGRHSNRRPSNKSRGERKNKVSKNAGKGTGVAKGSPAKPVPQLPDGYIAVQMLATTKITPNDYNPNELTEEEFKEYRAEAKRLGRLSKPIFVRPNRDGGYESVDGEHGWKVAQELGWAEVPCEVQDLDDFEAMRQTYKRNRHGSCNQVRLGRMFKKMMKIQKLSNRALARKIRVSETTVRNALLYADAAKMRNDFAPEGADDKIAHLTVKQVQQYHKLPKGERDRWLDAGADLAAIEPASRAKKPARQQATENTPAPNTDTEPVESATPAASPEGAPHDDDEAIPPTGQSPANPEAGAHEEPTSPSEGVPSERTDAVGPEPPEPKVDRKALAALNAAWEQTGWSERRVFLNLKRDDPESMAFFKAVLFPQYQG